MFGQELNQAQVYALPPKPRRSRITCRKEPEGMVLVIPAKGWRELLIMTVPPLLILLLAGWLILLSGRVHSMSNFAVFILVLATILARIFHWNLLWPTYLHARYPTMIELRNGQLILTATRSVSPQIWPIDEILQLDLKAEQISFSLRPFLQIRLLPCIGRSITLYSGRNGSEIRWLTATLRDALALPPDGSGRLGWRGK
jgi:hypothetical protein